jgi:hypothetical protein
VLAETVVSARADVRKHAHRIAAIAELVLKAVLGPGFLNQLDPVYRRPSELHAIGVVVASRTNDQCRAARRARNSGGRDGGQRSGEERDPQQRGAEP